MRDLAAVHCSVSIETPASRSTSVHSKHTLVFISLMPAARMLTPRYSIYISDNCFAAAGIWHPDNRALTKVRTAIVRDAKQWATACEKLTLEGERLARPPRGFDPNHPFIDDLKMKDFVSSVVLTEEQICSNKLMRDFVSACRTMSSLVEFTTKALGLKF